MFLEFNIAVEEERENPRRTVARFTSSQDSSLRSE